MFYEIKLNFVMNQLYIVIDSTKKDIFKSELRKAFFGKMRQL